MSSLSFEPPGAHTAPGPLTSFLVSAQSVLALPSWWRQQAWVAATEMLMGFLAAWGLIQGLPAVWIPMGLAMAYGTNSLGMWCLRTYGRRAGWTAWILASVSLATTLGLPVLGQWVGLCFTVGVLLAFRDHQSVHSLAWMPVH